MSKASVNVIQDKTQTDQVSMQASLHMIYSQTFVRDHLY